MDKQGEIQILKDEESKYFIDEHGTLCLMVQANFDTTFVFQVVGVFGYQIPDKADYNLGFMIQKYQKKIKN